jgi:dynein heavy chain
VFLSAATISYLGAFTGVYRDPALLSWMDKFRELDIPFS